MKTHKAKLNKTGEGEEKVVTLDLHLDEDILSISLTEDSPDKVRDIFNKLILKLKEEEFNFELEQDEEDLYYEISVEYIEQLNKEILTLHKDLEEQGLINL